MLQTWTMLPDRDAFMEVWDAGATAGDICEHFGITHADVESLAQKYGAKGLRRLIEVDPTADEIRERAAAVRKNWSKAEERRRRGAARRLEIPQVNGPSWLA